jgi:hypothetical protein
MFTTGHPEEGVLEQYCMGQLNEPEIGHLEEHILICPSCQDRVESTETYIRSMKSALGAAEKTAAERRPWRERLGGLFQMPAPAWAAVAALVVAGVWGGDYLSRSVIPVAVALSATRGEAASVKASGPLDLTLDARDLPATAKYRVQVVNADGGSVWETGSTVVQDGNVHVRVKHLARGQYFIRLFASDASTPREYALQLR